MRIKEIFTQERAALIAEIGINHNGDRDSAKKLIIAAAQAGADAVKFQTYNPESLYSVYTKSLMETGSESFPDRGIINFFAQFYFSPKDLAYLKKTADSNNVEFFSAPFDIESVDTLEKIGVRLYKVASSEVTNIRLLNAIAQTGKPVLLSTGMTHEKEIAEAVSILNKAGCDLTILHCVSLYPLQDSEMNLSRMSYLAKRFEKPVGFSDHSKDITGAVAASFMGASVIEKHFTLGGDYRCPDENVSVDPSGLKKLDEELRKARVMMGNGAVSFDVKEAEVAKGARRSLYAKKAIPAGKVLDEHDMIEKRPGVGIPADKIYFYIGKRSRKNIEKDFLLHDEYFE